MLISQNIYKILTGVIDDEDKALSVSDFWAIKNKNVFKFLSIAETVMTSEAAVERSFGTLFRQIGHRQNLKCKTLFHALVLTMHGSDVMANQLLEEWDEDEDEIEEISEYSDI